MSGRGRPAQQRLPLQPLLDLEGCSIRELGERIPFDERSITRWKAEGGIPEYHADVATVTLGLHPWSVWGDLWWEVVLAAEEAVHVA